MEHGRGRSMIARMQGAARLQVDVYVEVEADATATAQAAGVVGIVAIASALGGLQAGAAGFLGGLVAAYIGWIIWSAVTYLIGDKLLGGTATWGELLRTLGFAQSPGVLFLLGSIPLLGWLIRFVVSIWILIAAIIAIRQALDFSTGRALLTAVLGWIAYLVLAFVTLSIVGIPQ